MRDHELRKLNSSRIKMETIIEECGIARNGAVKCLTNIKEHLIKIDASGSNSMRCGIKDVDCKDCAIAFAKDEDIPDSVHSAFVDIIGTRDMSTCKARLIKLYILFNYNKIQNEGFGGMTIDAIDLLINMLEPAKFDICDLEV